MKNRVRRSSSDSVSAYRPIKKEMPQEQYLLVDGYNIIFSWEDLNELSRVNMEGARSKLGGSSLQLSGIPEMPCDPGF